MLTENMIEMLREYYLGNSLKIADGEMGRIVEPAWWDK